MVGNIPPTSEPGPRGYVSVGESHGHVDCESAGHADIFATAYALYSSPLTNHLYTITNSLTIRIF